ncbi:hypothetical protein GQ44DRAFT_777282 [Phaeosphaeriaceae sp. PMI808]|nr:hypothetical protein GQ44DRAFT_777282 [Phaeosphaeriaceae sp. PMI808]
MNRDEKVLREVTTMRFIKAKTRISVPKVIAWGGSNDNLLKLGPFIIMEFVKGEPLGEYLEDKGSVKEGRSTLRPDVLESNLDVIYHQVARFLLELLKYNFAKIGSLVEMHNQYDSEARPLTVKVNEMEAFEGIQSMDDGKLWFYELLYNGFLSVDNAAWTTIQAMLPESGILAAPISGEVDTFVGRKMIELQQYEEAWNKMRKERETLLEAVRAIKMKTG